MTLADRRERARLHSEAWRRAHGVGPRKPAQKPWLALGVSRSTSITGGRPRPVGTPRWHLKLRVDAKFFPAPRPSPANCNAS